MKQMSIVKVLLFSGLIVMAISCKKKQAVNFHLNYYPIEQNRFVVYAVHEEIIDSAVNQHDSFDYFIKTKFGDTVIDNQGRIARKYFRYYSSNSAGPWDVHDVWIALITDYRAELTEENNRLIKLVFAPSKFKEWNANAYTTLDPLDCYYDEIHKPFSRNGLSFDSTVRVIQDVTQVGLNFYRNKYEVYAKNVGLVYKYEKDLEIYNFDTTAIKKGHFIQLSAVDYGVE